jgi:hypothetical protein
MSYTVLANPTHFLSSAQFNTQHSTLYTATWAVQVIVLKFKDSEHREAGMLVVKIIIDLALPHHSQLLPDNDDISLLIKVRK